MDTKILEKLGKIKRHMESAADIGNEDEAAAFAAMLQNLLMKHKLDMSDVEYASEMKEEPIVEETIGTCWKDGKQVYRDFPDVEVRNRRVPWIEHLGGIICRYHSCEVIVTRRSSKLYFCGHKSNVQVVTYLFVVLHRAAEKLADKAYAERWRECLQSGDVTACRGFRNGFLQGFVHRIGQRFQEELDKFQDAHAQAGALVRVNKEALAVKNYLAGRTTVDGVGGTTRVDREGFNRGKKAADAMNLKANAFRAGQPNKQQELGGSR